MPVRLMLLGVIYKMFRSGLTYQNRTREVNKVILYEIFSNLVEELGLV